MIPLDSPRWNELRHAYGNAADIPGLLEQLPSAPVSDDSNAEPWYSLWSALCHQDDVYTASYAAVPHIVAAVSARPVEDRPTFLFFVAYVELCRHRPKAPAIPDDIESDYRAALQRAEALAVDALRLPSTETELRYLVGSIAALKGHPLLAHAIIDLEPEMVCPKCHEVFTVPAYDQQ
ncbi:MAG TPA: hypothetical protein VFV19_19560 [Candidatus Polarisedimenticolaceae bacterium]|nr:hypothetical protein [Candidatus Polarisedimenticolaceae bacterium]